MVLCNTPAGLFVDRLRLDFLAAWKRHCALAGKIAHENGAVGKAEAAAPEKLAVLKGAFVLPERLAVDVPGQRTGPGEKPVFAAPRPGDGFARRRVRVGCPAIGPGVLDPMGIVAGKIRRGSVGRSGKRQGERGCEDERADGHTRTSLNSGPSSMAPAACQLKRGPQLARIRANCWSSSMLSACSCVKAAICSCDMAPMFVVERKSICVVVSPGICVVAR